MLDVPGALLLDYGALADPRAPLNRGVLGWWRVLPLRQGGLQWWDCLGRNPGTLQNGPLWVGQAPTGAYGALKFDGTNDAVQTPKSFSFPNRQLTMACWLRLSTTGSYQQVMNIEANLIRIEPSGMLNVFYTGGDGHGGGTLSTLTWTHVVGVIDGLAQDILIYVNGTLVTTEHDVNVNNNSFTAPCQWGQYQSANFFSGWLDDARLYNRVLSASEARALYVASTLGYRQELASRQWPFWGALAGGRSTKHSRVMGRGMGYGLHRWLPTG